MTHLFWVALHGMAHSFTVLDKAVVHVIRLVSFLWLWFSVCLSSDGEGQEAYGGFLMGETDWGGTWVLFWWVGPCSVCGSAGKEWVCNLGNLGSIPGLGRSPAEGKCSLLQDSGLENSMDLQFMGSQRVGLRDFHFHYTFWWVGPCSVNL